MVDVPAALRHAARLFELLYSPLFELLWFRAVQVALQLR